MLHSVTAEKALLSQGALPLWIPLKAIFNFMGYAVLHIDKAGGNDSAMTAHIERTFVPNNVDATRTHLNRELVQFPTDVTNRTEAIEHRIATANIYRKVADNQVKALRFILSGSHEDMLRLESEGRLGEWCDSTMQWLYTTFGKENVVAATLHADEETPHIHATIVPIVQGERRKAKTEAENGKRKYKTKKNKVRLCADDVLTPKKLEEYQTTYAEQMMPFGLERYIRLRSQAPLQYGVLQGDTQGDGTETSRRSRTQGKGIGEEGR